MGLLYGLLELNLEMETLLHAARADLYARTVRNAGPLEVRVLAAISGRVEFGSANRVGVFSNDF